MMRNGTLLASSVYLPFALGWSGYTDDGAASLGERLPETSNDE